MENEFLGAVVKPLCLWYEKNKRSMPWREDASPYHVWLSEIMLQQTRIEAAKAYYERFLNRIPTIHQLAEVPEEELLKLWEGLGYYNRARNLQKAARLVVEKYDGQLPADYDLLLELPGIGNYTAGAIASIAYGLPAPAVDGNVLRVLMRVMNCRDDITKASVKKKMEQAIRSVIPEEKPGEFNQALMELGEVICIPNGVPLCEKCPLASLCLARKEGCQMELPIKPEKKARRIEKKTVLVLEQEGCIGILQRPEGGLLANMWEFPCLDGYRTMPQIKKLLSEDGLDNPKAARLEDNRHIFSHVEWHMRGYRISLPADYTQHLVDNLVWAEKSELEKRYAIPVAYHSFFHQSQGDK
jgi:A/G-specific adenine glycosylase